MPTRSARICLTVLAVGLACAAEPAAPQAAGHRGQLERAVIRRVNDVRAEYGLASLSASRGLSRAADAHTRDMLQRDFFDHTSSDGTSFDRRIHRYVDARAVGETLAALGQRRGVAAMVVRLWMESPPHREVLLAPEFRRIGVARRWGELAGAERAVVTADFASRRSA
jgi:uncharacterized protein YkwD